MVLTGEIKQATGLQVESGEKTLRSTPGRDWNGTWLERNWNSCSGALVERRGSALV